MVAKGRLAWNPPVRRNTTDRALTRRVDAEHELRVGRQRAIATELQIEDVVEEGVGADANDLLRVHLLDKGTGGRRRRQSRADVREAPSGDRVPDVLDGRIVVGGHAPQQIMAPDIDRIGVSGYRYCPSRSG